jgi:hypothetical protein
LGKYPTNPDSYRDRGAAAGSGLVKGFTFLKGETFLYNPFDLYPISCIFAL